LHLARLPMGAGEKMRVRIFIKDTMDKVFGAFWAAHPALSKDRVTFLFDGQRVEGKHTPDALDMETCVDNLVEASIVPEIE
jgi:hypothetical protein